MFAKSYPPLLAGTLLAAAWLSTTAAGRPQDHAGRTVAGQPFGVAEMSDLERTIRLDDIIGDAEDGLADNDVRVTASTAGPDVGSMVNLYWPSGDGPYPVLVYFREAGPGSNDVEHAGAARALATAAAAVVVSVGLATGGTDDDRPAPTQVQAQVQAQAYQAYRWALANAGGLGGDPHRVAVMGIGLAGPVAMAVATRAQAARLPPPYCLVLANTPTSIAAARTPARAPASPSPRFQDIAWSTGDARSARSTTKTYRAM